MKRGGPVRKQRLEAFSDGVIAVLITIMVLGLKIPRGTGLGDLRPLWPQFLTYVLSFAYLGIYWNNHHHLLHAADRINGRILWANLHLLFWLSLIPFGTGWMGENGFAPLPTAVYGAILLFASIAYLLLQRELVAAQAPGSKLAAALAGGDVKGKVSPLLYAAAIPISFVEHWVAYGIYTAVALIWLVPDRRIESRYYG